MGYEIRTTQIYGIFVGQQSSLPEWFVSLFREKFKDHFEVSRGYYAEDLASDDPEVVADIEKGILSEALSECYLYGWALTEDEEDGPRVISFGEDRDREIVIGFEEETTFVKPGRGGGSFGKTEDVKKKRKLTDAFLAEHKLEKADTFSLSYEC